MANTLETIVDGIKSVTNPKITTIIEFDRPTTTYLAGSLAVAGVIIIIVWAIARKMSNSK